MRYLTVLATLLSIFLLPLAGAQQADIICDNNDDLTTYLLSLIDQLYANGLTVFEQLIAKVSESDTGYSLLESWHSNDVLTLFAPTDHAFQLSGILPPFGLQGEDLLRDILAYHTVKGRWTWDTIPDNPFKGIGETLMPLKDHLNATVESPANAPLVFQRGENGAISIRLTSGNATTWGWTIDTANSPVKNIVIIPVDTVLPFPPKFSEVLTMPTTSRSTRGLPELGKALDVAGGAEKLQTLTEKGFTFFAPVDDAFTPQMKQEMADQGTGVKILGNHYATNYSLFSPGWTDKVFSLPVVSGKTLAVHREENGTYVTMGSMTARILRSDIPIENGVMHLIDHVLVDDETLAEASATGSSASGTQTRTSGTSRPSGNDSGEVVVQTENGAARDLAKISLVAVVLLSGITSIAAGL